ncbi:MAG: ATP synthase subunit I [Thermodesulfobacteriota bacterium]
MGNRLLIVDDGFLQRVQKTSLLLSLFVIISSLAYWDSSITLGLILGAFISLTFFGILCWTINRLFKLDSKKRGFFAIKITLLKFPLLAIVLYYALSYISINPLALIVGIGIVQVVIILKIFGILLVNYMNPLAKR